MSNPVPVRDLIPPDLLDNAKLLAVITGRSNARLVADRPLPELADTSPEELR